MKIIPLSEKYLAQAIELVERVFPTDEALGYKASDAFQASLNPKTHPKIFEDTGIQKELKYFLALEDGEVLGTTGYYIKKAEPSNAWLGWFCVDPKARSRGIGQKLLEYTIELAKERGFEKLRLYTSRSESEAAAQPLYEKLGLKIYAEGEEYGEKVIFREKNLI